MEIASSLSTEKTDPIRPAKTRTVGIRLTEPEYLALQRQAYERGKTISEWGRDKVLDHSEGRSLSEHIFTELVGLELLLINALPPLLRGDHMLPNQVENLKNQVQAIKKRKAQELLSKRAEERDEFNEACPKN